jgi:hypothetical protein
VRQDAAPQIRSELALDVARQPAALGGRVAHFHLVVPDGVFAEDGHDHGGDHLDDHDHVTLVKMGLT